MFQILVPLPEFGVHIGHAQACCNAGMGYPSHEMAIQIRAVDVMAGGRLGGGSGPEQLICHQEPGTQAGTST